MTPFQQHLKALLDELDACMIVHDEVGDTDVREQMSAVVTRGCIHREAGYVPPDELGMFSTEGNQAVKSALQRFMTATATCSPDSPSERFAAFQDETVRSSKGSSYDEFFGHADSLASLDETGDLPSTLDVDSRSAVRPWWKFWA